MASVAPFPQPTTATATVTSTCDAPLLRGCGSLRGRLRPVRLGLLRRVYRLARRSHRYLRWQSALPRATRVPSAARAYSWCLRASAPRRRRLWTGYRAA